MMAKGRVAAALLLSLLLGFLIVRQALVQAYAKEDPNRAALLYPGHPDIVLEMGLAAVGEAAAAGRNVERSLTDPLIASTAKAPLAPEPFLVRGVAARLAGDEALAGEAFRAAMIRNPRSVATRYFLADHYVATNQAREGLAEISALARLVPQSVPRLVPYLAIYAAQPAAAPQVKAMIRREPQLESALLNELAGKPENAELLLYLWSGRSGAEASGWQSRMVNGLVEAGRYDQAKKAWSRFTRLPSKPDELFDPQFEARTLPPFGWNLVSGPSGVAEPDGSGRLHVLYYGRDNLTLASQQLTLPPGRYSLSMRVDGAQPTSRSLAWTVTCLPLAGQIASISLDRAANGQNISIAFDVPATCPAQRLDLVATALEFPEKAEVTVSRLRLERESPR